MIAALLFVAFWAALIYAWALMAGLCRMAARGERIDEERRQVHAPLTPYDREMRR